MNQLQMAVGPGSTTITSPNPVKIGYSSKATLTVKTPKPVALVDCNNFYASCERVFNPALRGRPVIVLSNNDGCVIARSNEAKELKIQMGQPVYQMCRNAPCFSCRNTRHSFLCLHSKTNG